MYIYRSKFTHEGKSPPHKNPGFDDRFFEVFDEYNEKENKYETHVLANYRLINFIAQYSINEYVKSLVEKD